MLQWELNWACSEMKPNYENYSFHACENVIAYPICPPGQFITSGSLKYGRWNNNICPGTGINISTPISFEIFSLPFDCLHGVQGCFLGYSDRLISVFGDPFPGVGKHVSNIICTAKYIANYFNVVAIKFYMWRCRTQRPKQKQFLCL